MSLKPTSQQEVQEIVKTNQGLLPLGGGSKSALSTATNGVTELDMSHLSGIIEYEPNEYTFTAYSGTPIHEVVAALAKYGQYLPFDPLMVKQGATLGGMVASNTSGSGRYRYGGVRDFILGLHFVDGQGQLVRSGGKVVKNSAGFDLPKFMVGSLGRFGVFVDLSFKVFPQPRSYVTLKITYPGLASALKAIYYLAPTPYEMDALDLEPLEGGQFALLLRLGGLDKTLPGRVKRLQTFLQSNTDVADDEVINDEAEMTLWADINNITWLGEKVGLVKVPLPPKRIPDLDKRVSGLARRYSVGGNVAWLAVSNLDELHTLLTELELSGLVLVGQAGRPYLGVRKGLPLAQRVKQALDPDGKFLAI